MWIDEYLNNYREERMAEAVGTEDIAHKMADMTISTTEDEATEAQAAMHKLRGAQDVVEEQKELLKAEIRRLEFALSELGRD